MPTAPLHPSTLPPVTVLCGFLGAGKTTLLNHLLAQADGRRWAAVVNDVAAINIDAVIVRRVQSETRDIVELGNGCVCCSSRDELGETLARLASEGNYDHILVETTGVAEPRGIAALFTQRNPFGRSVGQFARLSALVSVVDSRQFLDEWKRRGSDAPRAPGATKPIFDLMIEQVECADVIVLNKSDLLNDSEKDEIDAVIAGLNTRAQCVRTERSQVSSELLLDRPRFSPVDTLRAATWIQLMNRGSGALRKVSGEHFVQADRDDIPAHEAKYGLRSFVFQARRPFAAGKLQSVIADAPAGLVRAKGFFWLADRPDEMGFLSVAGRHAQYDFLSYWWAAMVERGKAARADVPASLEEIWQDPVGDRRQELVFIGVGLDEAAWRARLEASLT